MLLLQIASCGLLVVMYLPQIKVLFEKKQAKDISFIMYLSRIASTLISMYTLTLSNNGLIVVIGQYVSLFLSSIVFGQMIYYTYVKVHGKHVEKQQQQLIMYHAKHYAKNQ